MKKAETREVPTFQFLSDDPTTQDELGQKHFAESVAKQIMNLEKKKSFVVGLSGSWGSGKSSVVQMIKAYLEGEGKRHYFSFDFNPWRYREEDLLIQEFFSGMAGAISKDAKKSLTQEGRKTAAKLLKLFSKYTSKFKAPPVVLDGGLSVGLSSLLSTILQSISSLFYADQTTEQLKEGLDKMMEELAVPMLVFIDDVDRLNNQEVKQLFRLVKLVADFPNVRYIITYDESMVSHAIGREYGKGTAEDGISFLEKIIQIPLKIPEPNSKLLFQLSLKHLVRWNKRHFQKIDGEFAKRFILLHEEFVRTPRDTKRLVNAVAFTYEILAEEINVYDLVLIEFIRLFVPRLFEFIVQNPKLFIKNFPTLSDPRWVLESPQHGVDEHMSRVNLIDLLPEALNLPEQTYLKIVQVIRFLFPYAIVEAVWSGGGFSQVAEAQKAQRIHVPQYFLVYMEQGITDDRIPDEEFREMFKSFNQDGLETVERWIIRTKAHSLSSVLDSLSLFEAYLTPKGAAGFFHLLSVKGEEGFRSEISPSWSSHFNEMSRWWVQLLYRVQADDLPLATELVENITDWNLGELIQGTLLDLLYGQLEDQDYVFKQVPERTEFKLDSKLKPTFQKAYGNLPSVQKVLDTPRDQILAKDPESYGKAFNWTIRAGRAEELQSKLMSLLKADKSPDHLLQIFHLFSGDETPIIKTDYLRIWVKALEAVFTSTFIQAELKARFPQLTKQAQKQPDSMQGSPEYVQKYITIWNLIKHYQSADED